jgi:hypothetical protein
VGHVVQFAARADLDEELVAHGAEEFFDLPPTGRPAGPRVDEADAEHGAGPLQLLVDHRAAVVQIQGVGDPAGSEAVAQRAFQPHGVLAAGPPIPGQQAAVVIDEREQDRLAPADGGAVQRVAGPALVRRVGLEPAERLRRQPARPRRQLQAHEVPLQGPLVR